MAGFGSIQFGFGSGFTGAGSVTGTGTDNHVVRWDGTGIPVIQDSAWEILDGTTGSLQPTLASTDLGGPAAANRIDTLFLASTFDYTGTLNWISGASTRLSLTTAGVFTINSAYSFPTADGLANQVLQTDGLGTLTFVTATDLNGIYGGNGTVPAGVVATLTDTINFTGGLFGIGATPNSTLHVEGSTSFKRVASAINVNTDDEVFIGITNTAAPRTVTIQTADIVVGRIFIIKDESGAAGTNNITVATQGAQTIDGAATVLISANFGVVRLYNDGTNLFTF